MTIAKLVLAEKPSQARDIAKVLGADRRREGALYNQQYTVTWCIGHLLEMAQPEAYDKSLKRWSLHALPITPSEWMLQVKPSVRKQFNIIRQLLRDTRSVIIATDADREGEVIAREVLDQCRYKGTIQRLWLSALDPKSIRRAFEKLLPEEQTRALYYAGLARARADWLVGMNLSRYYTLTAKNHTHKRSVLSVGRVQTPTLALVVNRDREIEAFQPKPYWDLFINAQNSEGHAYWSKWLPEKSPTKVSIDEKKRCISESQAKAVAKLVENKPGEIQHLKAEDKQIPPPLGYSLSTLQTDASSKWGFSADKTLKLAQSLYETHKICSYPRTDCQYLPTSQFSERHAILDNIQKHLPHFQNAIEQATRSIQAPIWNQKEVDEASHHAIIPTTFSINISRLNADEKKLYERICRRYLAQFFPNHTYRHTQVTTCCEKELFIANGKIVLDMGWHKAYRNAPQASSQHKDSASVRYLNQDLPALSSGDTVEITATDIAAKKTEPPPHHTEGSLIRAMKSVGRVVKDPKLKKVLRETSGIGQEATRANIIQTLLQRDYIKTVKRQLHSTPKGRALIDSVPDTAKSPETTAIWEQALDGIAKNQTDIKQFLSKQEEWIRSLVSHKPPSNNSSQNRQAGTAVTTPSKVKSAADQMTVSEAGEVSPECPKCGNKMVKRQARKKEGSLFWGCSQFPNCRQTLNFHPPA